MLAGLISSAEAAITIKSAAVQNGVAVVEGQATLNAPIVWEDAQVTQATSNNGGFKLSGVVPADCVGTLEDGGTGEAIDVALANCVPVPGAPVERTRQRTC